MKVYQWTDVPPVDRLDYWEQVLSDTILPSYFHQTHKPLNEHTDSQVRTAHVGVLRVTEASVAEPAGCGLERTRRLIRHSEEGFYSLTAQILGQMVVEQDGRQALLRPGALTIVDDSRPSQLMVPRQREANHVSVRIPQELLPVGQGNVAKTTATNLARSGITHGTAALAHQMASGLDALTWVDGARLSNALLDMLAVALNPRQDPQRPDTRLLEIQAYIEAHLGDHELSPAAIAAANHISVRHLYNLFATQELTVSGWIRQRRLERCRQDLLNPDLRSRPVSAIAARWGFLDASHFARLFRTTFGVPPNEYRSGRS